MLLSTTDEDVLAAAEALAESLNEVEPALTDEAFTSTLLECNEAISRATGVDYSSVCEAESDCC
ncbi:halo-CC-star protein HcsS [Natronomonas sp. LN261]|uniref:halo-CC-star protein HcsS n=1 Tax=Natronomonas sp. LN261 TaxID=2750669 RepID=UPI0015EF112C